MNDLAGDGPTMSRARHVFMFVSDSTQLASHHHCPPSTFLSCLPLSLNTLALACNRLDTALLAFLQVGHSSCHGHSNSDGSPVGDPVTLMHGVHHSSGASPASSSFIMSTGRVGRTVRGARTQICYTYLPSRRGLVTNALSRFITRQPSCVMYTLLPVCYLAIGLSWSY